MNRYLLLILLTSWSLLVTHSEECDTGVAFENSILSVTRSTLANADVALLESFTAESVEKCMEDCCSGKYGACSIASFKRNSTTKNCFHYNCRPLMHCKFLSSTSTDSFTFSSNSRAPHPVPSSSSTSTTTQSYSTTPKAKTQFEQPHAMEEIANFSDEQVDLKNDNTTVKPRKGVTALSPDAIITKSGIKPRKGVTFEDVPHSKYLLNGINKSNVKPRKGVGTYDSISYIQNNFTDSVSPTTSFNKNSSNDEQQTANELVSELAKLFEDDTTAPSPESSTNSQMVSSEFSIISPTSTSNLYATTTMEQFSKSEMHPSYTNSPLTTNHQVEPSFSSIPNLKQSSSVVGTSTKLVSTTTAEHYTFSSPIASAVPSLSARTHLMMDEPKSVDKTLTTDSQESEKSRKYKSSIHLVLSLVFGLLVLFAVLGVVAKRMYDGWQRRDYYRMNYLIDGIYNGYE